jgi:hypothetical protein
VGATGIDGEEQEQEQEVTPECLRAYVLFNDHIITLRWANSALKHDVDLNNI